MRGPGIAGEAEPVALQVRDQAAGSAGGVGAGWPAGVGAVPAPAGALADPAGLAAPRAGLLGIGPPVSDQAQAADLATDPPDFPAAADACPRAQDALAGHLVQLPGLAAARALVPGRAMGQGVVAAGAMLPARDADRPAAADALADLDRHRLRASDRRHRPAPGGPGPGDAAAPAGADTAGRSTGVVSRSNRSSGVHCRGGAQREQRGELELRRLPGEQRRHRRRRHLQAARSASSRRSWLPVQTSRWAAAIRSFHRICMLTLLRSARPERPRPPAGRRPR